jgi:Ni/Co efflux regulator RcnB
MFKALYAALLAAALFAAPIATLQPNAAAQTTAPAPGKKAKTKKPPTAGQLAARERMKKCAAEWKEAKAAGKVEKGMKWPKYWSACNKRLKTAG